MRSAIPVLGRYSVDPQARRFEDVIVDRDEPVE
jgi:hypothetical protein